MDDIRRSVLREKSTFLHSNLFVTPYFYDTALQHGVFSEEVKETLQDVTSTPARRSQLIDYLKKCGDEQYDAFLYTLKLKEIGQTHIAQQLEQTETLLRKQVNENAKGRVKDYLQDQYYTNRLFNPAAIEWITQNFVLREDFNKEMVQNNIHMEISRKLKTEVLEKEDKIGDMKDLLSENRREIGGFQFQINQLNTTLHDQMRKYNDLKKDYFKLQQQYNQAKDKNNVKENNDDTLIKETALQINTPESKAYIEKLKNDMNKLSQKYEEQKASIQNLNQSVAEFIGEETCIKGRTDPLKQLERSIKLIGESISGAKKISGSSQPVEHSDIGANSFKKLQEKLNQESKEKMSYKDKLKITTKKMGELSKQVDEMKVMLNSCASSMSSGSRRCSVIQIEQMDSLPEEMGTKRQLPSYTLPACQTTVGLPLLSKRAKVTKESVASSYPSRHSSDFTRSAVNTIRPKEFKFQISRPLIKSARWH